MVKLQLHVYAGIMEYSFAQVAFLFTMIHIHIKLTCFILYAIRNCHGNSRVCAFQWYIASTNRVLIGENNF